MEWNNINVEGIINNVETEEVFINNVTIKHGKRRDVDKTFMSDLLIIIFKEVLIVISYDGV